MASGTRILMAGALCGALAACADVDPRPFDNFDLYTWDLDAVREMAPQGPSFVQGLRVGYLDLTEAQRGGFDRGDYDHFARKAVESAKGLFVQPDMVALRSLSDEAQQEFTAARARLMSALDATTRKKAPLASSRAQVAYDCWMESVEEGDVETAARCKAIFEQAIADAEASLVSNIDNVYIVFFPFDQADITPVALQVLEGVATDFAEGEATRVILAGHADASGPADYNLGLSERRARSVAEELTAMGVDEDAFEINWYGETQLRVPTEDGVREPQNRRVEIEFE